MPGGPGYPPEQALKRFKRLVYRAAAKTLDHVKTQGQADKDKLGRLSVATALLRAAVARTYNMGKVDGLLRRHPSMREHAVFLPGGFLDPAPLKKFIAGLLDATDHFPSPLPDNPLHNHHPLSDNFSPITTNRSTSTAVPLAKRLKLQLPTTRKRLRALRVSDIHSPVTTCPRRMGRRCKGFWGKRWRRGPAPSARRIREYLGPRRTLPSVVAVPDDQQVADVIIGTNNSCPGPDGIPFAVYRLLV